MHVYLIEPESIMSLCFFDTDRLWRGYRVLELEGYRSDLNLRRLQDDIQRITRIMKATEDGIAFCNARMAVNPEVMTKCKKLYLECMLEYQEKLAGLILELIQLR